MRVAFISYDFGEYSIRHANALAEQAEVLLVLAHDVAQEHVGLISDAVHFAPFDKPRLRQPLQQLRSIRQIVARIEEFEPDVVHFQSGHLWFNLALGWLKRWPLVVTIHNPRHHVGDRSSRRTPQFILAHGYRRADHVIVHGQQLKEETIEHLGIPADNIHVVPHIAMGERTEYANDIEEDELLVLFFGRIWEYKGLDYLIRAEPMISAQVPGVRIMIAGQGEDFDRYRRQMADPERFVVHNRYISDAERYEMFERAAVVVLPYIEATQSGVVPVASTHAKPVVATRVGSLPECIDDGHTGLLVPPRDAVALAEAISQLLTNPHRRHEMGQNAKRKLDQDCSPQVVAQGHLDVYQQAIGHPALVNC